MMEPRAVDGQLVASYRANMRKIPRKDKHQEIKGRQVPITGFIGRGGKILPLPLLGFSAGTL